MNPAPQNKMQKSDTIKTEPVLQTYTFPEYGIVIQAPSLEEAKAQLQVILDKTNKK